MNVSNFNYAEETLWLLIIYFFKFNVITYTCNITLYILFCYILYKVPSPIELEIVILNTGYSFRVAIKCVPFLIFMFIAIWVYSVYACTFILYSLYAVFVLQLKYFYFYVIITSRHFFVKSIFSFPFFRLRIGNIIEKNTQ